MKKNIDAIDGGLLFLRIGIGLSYMLIHGGPKIFGGPELWVKVGSAVNYFGIDFYPGIWGFLAALAEFGGGLLIILGILFRPALLFMVITMFVAAFQHMMKGDGIFRAAYPLELAIVLIALLIIGPGRYSIEGHLKRRKKGLHI